VALETWMQSAANAQTLLRFSLDAGAKLHPRTLELRLEVAPVTLSCSQGQFAMLNDTAALNRLGLVGGAAAALPPPKPSKKRSQVGAHEAAPPPVRPSARASRPRASR
jgi:hypothetical protein